jgi:hypothetical protein
MSAFTDTLARLRAEAGDELLDVAPPPTMASLGVGWSIHEKAPDDSDYWPRGGVVVHVTPNGAHSEETGEVVDRYTLVRAERGQLHWTTLGADQVQALTDANRPNAHTIWGVCDIAARELVARAKSRAPDHERALELWSLGTRLMAVLARPGTVAP